MKEKFSKILELGISNDTGKAWDAYCYFSSPWESVSKKSEMEELTEEYKNIYGNKKK